MNAYKKVYKALQDVMVMMPGGLGRFPKLYDVVSDALKTKPRNCDIGTAEEQMERHYMFCSKNKECHPDSSRCMMCYAKWSQMPYEEGGKK